MSITANSGWRRAIRSGVAACAACLAALGGAAAPASAGGLMVQTPVTSVGPTYSESFSDPCAELGYPTVNLASGAVMVCQPGNRMTYIASVGGVSLVYYQ